MVQYKLCFSSSEVLNVIFQLEKWKVLNGFFFLRIVGHSSPEGMVNVFGDRK